MCRGRQRDRTERRESSRERKGKTEAGCTEPGATASREARVPGLEEGETEPHRSHCFFLPGQAPTQLLELFLPPPDSQEPSRLGPVTSTRGSPSGPPLRPAHLSALSPKLSLSWGEQWLPSLLSSAWAGGPAWASA